MIMDPVNQDQPNNISEGYEERKYDREDGSFDLYHGSIINNMMHGKGTMIYSNGNVYEGQWNNNQREGDGNMRYSNGNVYEGQWNNNQREGDGKLIFKNANDVYEGKFLRDKMHGIGKRFYSNGDKFEGYFNSGKRREGTFQFAKGAVFEGTFGCVSRDGKITSKTKMMTGTLTYKKVPIMAKLLGPKSTVKSVWIQYGQRSAVYRPVETKINPITPIKRPPTPPPTPPSSVCPSSSSSTTSDTSSVCLSSETILIGKFDFSFEKQPAIYDDNKNNKIWEALICCIMLVYIISMISVPPPPSPLTPITPGDDRRPWACDFPFAYMMSEKCMSDATLNPLFGDDLFPLLE